jgi:hypothetical protein
VEEHPPTIASSRVVQNPRIWKMIVLLSMRAIVKKKTTSSECGRYYDLKVSFSYTQAVMGKQLLKEDKVERTTKSKLRCHDDTHDVSTPTFWPPIILRSNLQYYLTDYIWWCSIKNSSHTAKRYMHYYPKHSVL